MQKKRNGIWRKKSENLCLAEYPEGNRLRITIRMVLVMIKTVIFDPVEKAASSIGWLGQEENGWKDFIWLMKKGSLCGRAALQKEDGNPEFFAFRPIG